jgi:hypothetical protein
MNAKILQIEQAKIESTYHTEMQATVWEETMRVLARIQMKYEQGQIKRDTIHSAQDLVGLDSIDVYKQPVESININDLPI